MALAWKNLDSLRAAVVSARLNAPSLAPYIVYLHLPEQPLEDDAFTRWARAAGARVVMHRLSFYEQLPAARRRQPNIGINAHVNYGTFGRMDVPHLVRTSLRNELHAQGIDTERVLYTDADVMFAAEFDYASRVPGGLPVAFAAGTEVFNDKRIGAGKRERVFNAGVMYLNVSVWEREWPRMLEYARERQFRFKTADQQWIQEWFLPRRRSAKNRAEVAGWDVLEDQLYNARPWWHPKLKVYTPDVEPRLWHWHGYKPADVECWLNAIRSGAWPERAWRDTEPNCNRGRCRFTPIVGSGCRVMSVLKPRPCYLRTYTHLLAQHQKLLYVADLAGKVV